MRSLRLPLCFAGLSIWTLIYFSLPAKLLPIAHKEGWISALCRHDRFSSWEAHWSVLRYLGGLLIVDMGGAFIRADLFVRRWIISYGTYGEFSAAKGQLDEIAPVFC